MPKRRRSVRVAGPTPGRTAYSDSGSTGAEDHSLTLSRIAKPKNIVKCARGRVVAQFADLGGARLEGATNMHTAIPSTMTRNVRIPVLAEVEPGGWNSKRSNVDPKKPATRFARHTAANLPRTKSSEIPRGCDRARAADVKSA